MKTVVQIDFADVFHFADREYGISWNPANDVFFGHAFRYGSVTDFYPEDWDSHIEEIEGDFKKASDVPKEIVAKMSNHDKSYVITAAYLESKNLTGEIQIDCR